MIARASVLILMLALIVGCGGKGGDAVPVKGKVVQGGAPFQVKRASKQPLPPGLTLAEIKFTALEGEQNTGGFTAPIDPDTGAFEMLGPTGKGLPPGKYKVAVLVKGSDSSGPPSRPPTGDESDPGLMALEGKEVAEMEVTIPPGGATDLVIDVSKKK